MAVITEEPKTQTALLGSYVLFRCRTAGSSPRWIINGTSLDPELEEQYKQERGINITLLSVTSRRFVSKLLIHTRGSNNTRIQCGVHSGSMVSNVALLLIHGEHFLCSLLHQYLYPAAVGSDDLSRCTIIIVIAVLVILVCIIAGLLIFYCCWHKRVSG